MLITSIWNKTKIEQNMKGLVNIDFENNVYPFYFLFSTVLVCLYTYQYMQKNPLLGTVSYVNFVGDLEWILYI